MKSKKLKGIIAIVVVGTIISTIAPVKASAEWLQDSENNWTWTENGNEAIGWKQVDGTWYHFDESGKMQTGWVKAEDSKWYYMNTDGAMENGWLKDSDGKWYNLAPSGEMKTGWIQETDGKWYFTDISGAMQTGVIQVEGKSYALAENGAMLIGQSVLTEGNTYTTDNNGVIIEGNTSTNSREFTKDGVLIIPDANSNTGKTTTTTADTSNSTGSSSSSSSSSSSVNIVSAIEKINDINVEKGTELKLPSSINITLSNNTTINVAVTWIAGNPAYDKNLAGKYTFTGTITLPTGVTNTNNLKASVNVNVLENLVQANEVKSIEELSDISVPKGTALDEAGLPNSVEITLSNNTTINVAVTWIAGNPAYDKNLAGKYTFTGTITLPTGVINTNNLKASVKVNVLEDLVQANEVKSIEELSNISVPKGTALDEAGLLNSVEITLGNNTTTSAAVTWDGGNPTYDKNTLGTYKFKGELTLPEGVTNPNDLKASVDVILAAHATKNIDSVQTIPSINAFCGENIADIGLPSTIDITLSDNTTTSAAVTWDSSGYNSAQTGTYTVLGIITNPENVTNTEQYSASVTITIVEPSHEAGFSSGKVKNSESNELYDMWWSGGNGSSIDTSRSGFIYIPSGIQNAVLQLNKSNQNSSIKFVTSQQKPSGDSEYTHTESELFTAHIGESIWILGIAQDKTTKRYYKVQISSNIS